MAAQGALRPAESSFLQDPPRLGNQFLEDTALREALQRIVQSKTALESIESDLTRFGARVVHELWPIAKSMDEEHNRPRLVTHDAWGTRVDRIVTCEGWKRQHDVAAEEGVVAIGYERQTGEFSRVHQLAKLYLYSPSAGLYGCPLAMTDGAARLMELSSWPKAKSVFAHLTSRDPASFWTSGQWMTERKGGSDVANGTETVARLQEDGTYRLYGYKWFTSATDSDMALTLARIEDRQGQVTPGSEGLSCFFVKIRDGDRLNNIVVGRLKNKLGTRQLPTAELELNGARAELVSPPGRGVATITSTMVNITRVYNATTSVAYMRRVLAIARDYAHRRTAFGELLSESPLHQRVLTSMEIVTRGCLFFVLETARLIGRVETAGAHGGDAQGDELLLRLLTPLLKLFCGKVSTSVVSEGLECLGGQGYMEDTGVPGLLRDNQVTTIWEGTTNVLSLDLVRVMQKSKFAATALLHKTVLGKCKGARSSKQAPAVAKMIEASAETLERSAHELQRFVATHNTATIVALARELALSLSRNFVGALLLEHASWSGRECDAWIADQWCSGELFGIGPIVARALLDQSREPKASRFVREVALDIDHVTGLPRGCGNAEVSGAPRARL